MYICCEDNFEGNPDTCSITNTFFVSASGKCYPNDQWTDFSVVVLEWWVNTIESAINCKSDRFELLFMDGSWKFECSRQGEDVVMRFMNCDRREARDPFITNMQEIVMALENAVHDLKGYMWEDRKEYANCISVLNELHEKLKRVESRM